MRLSGRTFAILLAIAGLTIVAATDQVVPASSAHQAQLRVWLAGRATGITAYLLLTLQVVLGLILSHPTNQTTWKLSKRLFPWHENAWVFVLAFLGAHVVSLVADPYAGVGLGGALIPGLSSYRSSAVALGTLALYALLVTGLTARYTKRLPPGAWLRIHRISIAVFALAWMHGLLAGTDSGALVPLYITTGVAVLGAFGYRHWVSRRARPSPSFSEVVVPLSWPASPRASSWAPPPSVPHPPGRPHPHPSTRRPSPLRHCRPGSRRSRRVPPTSRRGSGH